MNEFLKMDVFFFVTTVAIVLLTAFGIIVLWRFSRILKNIEHISEQVSLESAVVRADLAEMRVSIKNGKGKLKSLFNFFGTRVKRAKTNKK